MIKLRFSDAETLELAHEEARQLVQALWDLGLSAPGATISAVRLGDALRTSHRGQPVELDERESSAIRRALADLEASAEG